MNVAEWAQTQHIHPQAAYRWHRQGRLPVPARRVGGRIMVGDLSGGDAPSIGRTVVYARVSSADQKADLDAQVSRVTAWATSHGHAVDQVVTEVGSALNGKRRTFLGLLSDPEVATIIVEHRDRFARFGAEVVVDLVGDMTELTTSLCARLSGRRSATHAAARAVDVAVGDRPRPMAKVGDG